MVNEFHGLNAACAQLVPSGLGYENVTITNQVCTAIGSVSGQAFVNGMSYVEGSYGYEYSHLWRNFGIICVFGVAFIAMLLWLSEFNLSTAGDSSVTLFKRGSRVKIEQPTDVVDEEKIPSTDGASTRHAAVGVATETQVLEKEPAERNTFSFENLTYVVPVQDGHRKLLDNVSGYVAPGKLTALMGESGAGKTTLLNVLSERTSSGIITGQRLMNGQPLPIDFRSQT